MSYWTVIPTAVRKSRRLTSEEKDLYYEISERMNEGGYCTSSNLELAKALGVSEKTITLRLASLKEKQFAHSYQNDRTHKRIIYLDVPGEPPTSNEMNKPGDEAFEDRKRRLEESLKKAIVFGTIEFSVLIEKLYESPYLEDVKDNSTQFGVTLEQIEFIENLRRLTKKEIDCQINCFPKVNYRLLLDKVRESAFLTTNKNLNLKWILTNRQDILNDKYKQYFAIAEEKPNFQQRDYSKKDINSLFQNIEDIDV